LVDALAAYLSPTGLVLALVWNFAVLSSIQLTVRLIRAFSIQRTALAALALTAATVPITVVYNVLFKNSPAWLPLAMLLTAVVGWAIARWILRLRRGRSRVAAALGVGLLSGPWGAFLVRPP
jgi:putative effector of murein hydrolase